MFATLLTHHDRTHPHTVCPTLPQLEHWTPDLVAASPCLHPSRRTVFLPSHALALALAPFHPPFLCLCLSVDHPSQSAPSSRSRNICVSFVLRRQVLRLLHSSSVSASMYKDFWSPLSRLGGVPGGPGHSVRRPSGCPDGGGGGSCSWKLPRGRGVFAGASFLGSVVS